MMYVITLFILNFALTQNFHLDPAEIFVAGCCSGLNNNYLPDRLLC